jgi:tRNA pseudouridine38-40 synthase
MQRYFLHLAYKGTHYCGWQIQNGQSSVQETIEKALTRLNSNSRVELTGCGRTDTGVHASSYYAHFDLDTSLSSEDLRHKLNAMLPEDIAIFKVTVVEATAHARFSASSRTYQYHIHLQKNPFLADTSWHFNQSLNLVSITEACGIISAHTDFEAFSKVNTEVNHFNCTIKEISWSETADGYVFRITADRFLRNMVRAIVGTLIEVGLGKTTPRDVDQIIRSKNRSNAGKSVPAHGLILTGVTYPFPL